MDSPTNQRWLRLAMFFAIVYPVVGIVFAFAASQGMAVFWRLAAWLVCLVTFAVHLWYEHFRLQSPPYKAALRVSLAVALGAFLLAVWINVHAHWIVAHPRPFVLLSLVLFPVITGVPAFVVALVVASLLTRARRRSEGP
jgi:hypothetical protein